MLLTLFKGLVIVCGSQACNSVTATHEDGQSQHWEGMAAQGQVPRGQARPKDWRANRYVSCWLGRHSLFHSEDSKPEEAESQDGEDADPGQENNSDEQAEGEEEDDNDSALSDIDDDLVRL